MAQIERQQPYRSGLGVKPGHNVAGDLVQALTPARAQREAVLGDCPGCSGGGAVMSCASRIANSAACPAPRARPRHQYRRPGSRHCQSFVDAVSQKVRHHGAAYPVMADNDERMLAGQSLKLCS